MRRIAFTLALAFALGAMTQVSASEPVAPKLPFVPAPKAPLLLSTQRVAFFGDGPNVRAVRRSTGALLWRTHTACDASVQAAAMLNGKLAVGCALGTVTILDASNGHTLHTMSVLMQGINTIVPSGARAVAVEGWADGAALRNELAFVDVRTGNQIGAMMTDSSFLGVLDGRALIDDWCCFGRPDVYRPATIYWMSLADGSHSTPVELAPDPQGHPGRMQPLGQGASNYLIGTFLYVPVGTVTYRYNVRDLTRPPVRLTTP